MHMSHKSTCNGTTSLGGGRNPATGWPYKPQFSKDMHLVQVHVTIVINKQSSVSQYCTTWKLYRKDLHQLATLLQATLCFLWINVTSSLSHQTLNNVIQSLILWSITCIVKHILLVTIQNTQALFISFFNFPLFQFNNSDVCLSYKLLTQIHGMLHIKCTKLPLVFIWAMLREICCTKLCPIIHWYISTGRTVTFHHTLWYCTTAEFLKVSWPFKWKWWNNHDNNFFFEMCSELCMQKCEGHFKNLPFKMWSDLCIHKAEGHFKQ